MNLPDDVRLAYTHAQIHAALGNTQMAAASFLTWLMADDVTRRRCASMATMLCDKDVEWDVAQKWAEATKKGQGQMFQDIVANVILNQGLKETLDLKRAPESSSKSKKGCPRT